MLHLHENASDVLRQVDLFVFDIDGVLVDTSCSYQQAIVDAIGYYWRHILGWKNQPALSVNDTLAFKTISGFNNDWDLGEAYFVYTYLLANGLELPLSSFVEQVAVGGGGLEGLYRWLDQQFSTLVGQLRQVLQRQVLIQLFQEFYAGESNCRRFYGFAPRCVKGMGRCESEALLADPLLLVQLPRPLGILTGRNCAETTYALARFPGVAWQPALIGVDDGHLPNKPDPAKLQLICQQVGSRCVLFLGDSYDDWQTVQNFNRLQTDCTALFGQVTSAAPFVSTVIWADHTNEILQFLINIFSSKNARAFHATSTNHA